MKVANVAAVAVIIGCGVAHADARLDGRIALMKLTYACGSEAEYKTVRDAALRAEQMATVGTPDRIVLGIDRDLRDGKTSANVDKSQCADKLEQLRFDLKASGAY